MGESGEAPLLVENRGSAVTFLYGLTIFVSAFLLFQVQPIIAKIIVPWFGGSAAIWTTCLLFFQLVLLLGYLYAYWVINCLGARMRKVVHICLLALGILVLPILPSGRWKPSGPEWPTFHILLLLTVTVGLPYFLLSTTSPLLQAWYGQIRRGGRPYRLFAISNAASLLALLTYPVGVEPFISTRHQAMSWSLAFAGFVALCAVLAIRKTDAGASERACDPGSRPSRADQFFWVALSATSSTLLLAVTNHLTQNVAAIPFLWILPLSLYLLSFILCFEGRGWYKRGFFLRLLAVALAAMAYAIPSQYSGGPLLVVIPLYSVGLFTCCMVCHGEIAELKPSAEYLTSFYLMIALGGALGGVFVCLLAPHVFPGFFELPIGLGCCAVLVTILLRRDPSTIFYKHQSRAAWLVLLFFLGFYLAGLGVEILNNLGDVDLMVRNFYGCLTIINVDTSNPENATRRLGNGIIEHGRQFLAPDRRREPITYYSPNSGLGLAIKVESEQNRLHVGVIGLGAGTIAVYGRPGDLYTFYEINPLDIQLAHTEFTFLSDSPAKIEIIPGDARLSLERQANQNFDVLAVDAFSGDAIPIHLLTQEAFILYFRHLKPDGVLAVHVSNRYLDLKPVVQRVAESLGKKSGFVRNQPDAHNYIYPAEWMLVSSSKAFFNKPDIQKALTPLPAMPRTRFWTDDYSSLFGVLK
ncbi:MAG TPA: fused MFS/spermidine synthase [Terriglobia bacterium]|nr:fused MFS/spermidine synthase [Terriglobia bacterium]